MAKKIKKRLNPKSTILCYPSRGNLISSYGRELLQEEIIEDGEPKDKIIPAGFYRRTITIDRDGSRHLSKHLHFIGDRIDDVVKETSAWIDERYASGKRVQILRDEKTGAPIDGLNLRPYLGDLIKKLYRESQRKDWVEMKDG